MSSYLVESGGVEPHPVLHKDPVFKTGRGTNSPASLSIIWRSQGDSNPCRRRDKPLYSPGYTMGPKTGATDGNRTRLNRIDNPVPYPEDYCGKLASCTGIDPVPTPWKGVDLASNLAGYDLVLHDRIELP